MIAFLEGTIQSKHKTTLVIQTTGGVGYAVSMSLLAASEKSVGAAVRIFTYLKVSDSAMELYGFDTQEERDFFSLLLSVSGVGPKSALNILSIGSIEEIQAAIGRNDVKYLTAVQGMGKKTAERLVVELKSKVERHGVAADAAAIGGPLADVVDGLVAMGYAKNEAQDVAKAIDPQNKTTEQLLKEALRLLSR